MGYQINVVHRSDSGRELQENEDSVGYIFDDRNDSHLLIVADGLGGQSCGREASHLAVQSIRLSFFGSHDSGLPAPQRLAGAMIEANHQILNRASRDKRCRGMGSTCAILLMHGDQAFVAHTGDSRIYMVRDGRITRLTRDHSRVQRMLSDGLITEEEAATHPEKNWLDKALGLREDVKPDVRQDPIDLKDGDTFILCTDGLTNLVRDEELFSIIQRTPIRQACELLVDMANDRGGTDNITVAIARVGDEVTLPF